MSKNTHFIIFNAIMDVEDLSKGRMGVMFSLLRHRSPGGLSFPGIARICKETKFTKKYIIQYLASLEADGYIKRVKDHGASGSRVYEININRLLEQLERENSVVPDMPTTSDEDKPDVPTSEYGYQGWNDNYNPAASDETMNQITDSLDHFQVVEPDPTPEQQTMRHIEAIERMIRAGQIRQARLYAKTVLVISNEDLDAFIKEFKEQMEMEEV